MKTYRVKNKKGLVIGYIYFFTYYKVKLYKHRNQFIQEVIKNLKRTNISYAGFNKKRELEKILRKFIFFLDNLKEKKFKPLPKSKIQRLKVFQIIKDSLIQCCNYFSLKTPLRVFIFPCFSKFVETQMEGVSGFVPRQNVVYIFLHPKITHFEKRLKYTVVHEFYHAVSDKYCKKWNKSILGSLISEGLANNFCIKAIGGELTPALIALSQKQCQKIWSKVKKILNSKNSKIWKALFFGNKEYPRWSGYALGYQIVKSFLKKQPEIQWEEIMKISPKEILKQSNFN